MRKPLNQIQLYAALLPLRPKMLKFKEKDSASLTADEVKLLQDVYPDVQVLTSGALPMQVNVGCPSCIREIFHIFTSLFDRLEADPNVNKTVVEKPKTDSLFDTRKAAIEAVGFTYNPETDSFHRGDEHFPAYAPMNDSDENFNRNVENLKIQSSPEPIVQHVAESFPVVEPEPTQAPFVPLYNEGNPAVEPETSVKKRATKKAAKEVK